PSPAEELALLERMVDNPDIPLRRVLDREKVKQLRGATETIKAEEGIRRYIVSLVAASRVKDRRKLPFTRYIEYGASPRATLSIYRCARVQALFEGRSFVLPEDVKAVAPMAMRHRLVLSYEAEVEQMDADAVIARLLAAVSVP
ncbi:MAG: ATPase, partial [Spirochaetaceae bacterium]|nr:ATPase [Spirochaetaceae bacterium]